MKRKLLSILSLAFTVLVFFSIGTNVNAIEFEPTNSYYNKYYEVIDSNTISSYYNGLDTTLSSDDFRSALHTIISTGYEQYSYADIWTIDKYADADKYVEGAISCIYTGKALTTQKTSGSTGETYDREHIWAKSHGFPTSYKSESNNPAYSDAHHLRPAFSTTNTSRGNADFYEFGYTGDVSGYNTDEFGNKWIKDNYFEPRDEVKGDVARMLFYMEIRYGVDDSVFNLKLVNEKTSSSSGNGRFGYLNTLLKWHYQDPVSTSEIYRNNVVYQYQNNRNPFIDHPEYVDLCFINTVGAYNQATMAPKGSTYTNENDGVLRNLVKTDITVGFEADEGFTAGTTYNNEKYLTAGTNPWRYKSTGFTSTDGRFIDGLQSANLTYYQGKPNPKLEMFYDIPRLGKITFNAKNNASGYNLKVSSSYDGGATWTNSQTFTMTTTSKEYAYVVSSNSGYEKARIRFEMSTSKTTGGKYVAVDSICFYTGVESFGNGFSEGKTKASLKYSFDSTSGENITKYYDKLSSVNDLSVGDKFVIATQSGSFVMGDTLSTSNSKNIFSEESAIKLSYNDNLYTDSNNAITLCTGALDDTYALKFSNGKYLSCQGAQVLSFVDSVSNASSWYLGDVVDKDGNVIDYEIKSTYVGKKDAYVTPTETEALEGVQYYTNKSGTKATVNVGDDVTKLYVKTKVDDYYIIKNVHDSQRFSTYSLNTNNANIEIYKEYERNEIIYSYSNVALRFGTVISKSLYDGLLAEGNNVSFGVALSADETNYTNYSITPVRVDLSTGQSTTESETGNYYQFAAVINVSSKNYSSLVYAKCYVCIDGSYYYMEESCYSVVSIATYYAQNYSDLGIDMYYDSLKALQEKGA